MSQANVEIAMQATDALNRRDRDAFHRLTSAAGGRARVPRFGRARVGVEMLVFGVLAVAVVLGAVPASAQAVATWKFAGQGISDGRSQPAETLLTPANVPTLAPKWVLKT